jgi:hypothetical protein
MFYYPDWNAITFDGVLNPVLATLVSVLPGLIGKRLLELSQSGFLRAERGDDIRRWKLVSRIAFVFCLALAVATVIASWFSRYRYYVDDLLLFRLYVLLLVGLSTYVRWSLLILAVRTVALFLRSELQLPKARWARSEYVLQALGELGILVFAAFYGVVAYAAATMGTAVVKGVPLQSDALFWEATVHVVVSFVGAGLALMCLVYRPHAVLLAARQESSVGLGAKIPTLPILKSIWRQAILLVPFFLLTLIPWLLWVTGLVAEG